MNNTYHLPYGPGVGIDKIKRVIESFAVSRYDSFDNDATTPATTEEGEEIANPRNNFDGYTHYYSPPTIIKNFNSERQVVRLSGNHSGFLVPDWYGGLDPNKKYINCWNRHHGKSKEQFKTELQWSDMFKSERLAVADISEAYSEAIDEKLWTFVDNLLNLGFNPSQRGKTNWGRYSQTVFLAAIGDANLQIAQLVLTKGASIQEQDSTGAGALHYAFSSNRLESVKFLQTNGWDLNTPLPGHKSIFHLYLRVCSKPDTNLMNYLIEQVGITSESKFDLLGYYLQIAHDPRSIVLDTLYEPQFAKMTNEQSENLVASYLSNTRDISSVQPTVLQWLLERGVQLYNVDSDGNNALTRAFSKCKISTWSGTIEKAIGKFSSFGIPLGAKNNSKHHVLFLCVARDQKVVHLLSTLFIKEVDLLDKDLDGNTVLSLAVTKAADGLAFALAREYGAMKDEATVKKIIEILGAKNSKKVSGLARALLKEFKIPLPITYNKNNNSSNQKEDNDDDSNDSASEEVELPGLF